ncbi:structural maintenance of chromosomes 6 [Leptinotarsa decemlineata]|uniref:structural maintenance of chromosomes 6 n=1 Tax=Leptinotarsa decemlineata TaxID=7539 RepID=UPI003D30D5C5
MSTRKRKQLTQIELDEENGARKKSRTNNDDCEEQKRAGTIKHMVLKNFMCHSLLEVSFENNITIIIGKNGSGKSAILTALIVGLGGKASLTNRGSSVKGFVKAGKPSGSIEIELCNEGPMSYRPSVYGKRINIVRNLSSSGGGSYRIRSENGEVISTQAKEVQYITSSLNIQVDNPICILNQDTSRNFLSSNDPKNKFTLFMKATKLDTLEAEYKKVQGNKRDSIKIMEEKAENFKKLQDEIKRLKRKIENHKSIISLKDKKLLLQQELVWAKARDVEEELEEEKAKVESVDKKLNEFRTNSAKRGERISTLKEHIKNLEQQILEVKDQIEVQKRPQLDLRTQIEELSRNCASKKRERQQIQTSIESKSNDVKSLQEDIAASNENMSKVEQQKMERIKNLASLQNKLKGMDDHLETAKNDLFQIKSDLSRKEDDEKNLRREIAQLDQQIANEKNNLRAIQAESGNELLLYGRDMPRIKQMIAQYKNRFEKEPRGPLGSYIKLKDKKWAVAVEGYVGADTLCAFTVDNNKDNKLLREIFNKVSSGGRQPQVITSKFLSKKHDIRRNLVYEPNDCVSLYNAIEISDTIVSNCIVDSCSPENILLIPTDRRAQELLSDRRTVPRNCHQGITTKGDKYYPDPNYRTYASNYVRAKYLQVDTKEYIQQLQQTIESLNKKKQVIMSQLQQFLDNKRQQETRKDELEQKVRKVNSARAQIRKQLEELNSTAEPEVQNVQFLEQELEEVTRTLAEKSAALEQVNEEIREIRATITAKEQNLTQLKGSTTGLEERIQSLKDDVQESQTKQKEIATSDEFDKRRLREYEVKLNEARSQMVAKQNELKACTNEASSVGERLPDLRRVPNITKEINEVKLRIARIETDTEDVSEVMERYNELSEKFIKSADIMKSLQTDVMELTSALEKRNRHYKLTESYFITYMKYSFKKILEYRQFKGTIEINMQEKKLNLVVIPQHGSQGHTTTSNLSGGERSFSTVAFLYSLWQCMEFPFYFLDEFDVYMDKLNRTKVIDILLHHANSRPQLQFVFLTPQDVSFINKDVSILRLEDPERFNV